MDRETNTGGGPCIVNSTWRNNRRLTEVNFHVYHHDHIIPKSALKRGLGAFLPHKTCHTHITLTINLSQFRTYYAITYHARAFRVIIDVTLH